MVAIKGIKMSKNCAHCDFCTDDWKCFILKKRTDNIVGDYAKLPDCPSVSIKERKVGKWIKYNTTEKLDILGNRVKVSSYKCSECGRTISDISEDGFTNKLEDYPYCHCGAEMRGSENE